MNKYKALNWKDEFQKLGLDCDLTSTPTWVMSAGCSCAYLSPEHGDYKDDELDFGVVIGQRNFGHISGIAYYDEESCKSAIEIYRSRNE